jgi:hypothetical protein
VNNGAINEQNPGKHHWQCGGEANQPPHNALCDNLVYLSVHCRKNRAGKLLRILLIGGGGVGWGGGGKEPSD